MEYNHFSSYGTNCDTFVNFFASNFHEIDCLGVLIPGSGDFGDAERLFLVRIQVCDPNFISLFERFFMELVFRRRYDRVTESGLGAG